MLRILLDHLLSNVTMTTTLPRRRDDNDATATSQGYRHHSSKGCSIKPTVIISNTFDLIVLLTHCPHWLFRVLVSRASQSHFSANGSLFGHLCPFNLMYQVLQEKRGEAFPLADPGYLHRVGRLPSSRL